MDVATTETLLRRFGYIFVSEHGYPPICTPKPLPPHGESWEVSGPSGPVPIVTFDQDHGAIRSVGYRIGGVAYSSDVVAFPEASLERLQDLDVFVVDALRDLPHPTHAHVARALEWIEALKPRRAILTNLHIDLDYQALARRLPPGVEPAYDGMTFRSSL
jgi:phosphoribosyl 1,2-cyclic phosphate phosphodiesterase